MRPADAAFLAAFDALPAGTFSARYAGRRWIAARTSFAGGKAEKLVAEAADGSDRVSMTLYRLARGARFAPCEMPAVKVRGFVLGAVPEPSRARQPQETPCTRASADDDRKERIADQEAVGWISRAR
jgi:hypothetical protein